LLFEEGIDGRSLGLSIYLSEMDVEDRPVEPVTDCVCYVRSVRRDITLDEVERKPLRSPERPDEGRKIVLFDDLRPSPVNLYLRVIHRPECP